MARRDSVALASVLRLTFVIALLAGCGGQAARTAARPAGATAGGRPKVTGTAGSGRYGKPFPAKPSRPKPSPPSAPSALPVAPGAGARPQTRAFPGTGSAAFRNAMADLWLAVTTGKPAYGRPAFFPEAAYSQVKAIGDARADWEYRLWYDFALDVAAAHRLVGGGARLVRVIVPAQYAAWVDPGACYNSAGYWHAPGARVEYRQGGQVRSFGIASLISWRGVWYVVHFGAVIRADASGEVDAPATGPGVPGPPGGC